MRQEHRIFFEKSISPSIGIGHPFSVCTEKSINGKVIVELPRHFFYPRYKRAPFSVFLTLKRLPCLRLLFALQQRWQECLRWFPFGLFSLAPITVQWVACRSEKTPRSTSRSEPSWDLCSAMPRSSSPVSVERRSARSSKRSSRQQVRCGVQWCDGLAQADSEEKGAPAQPAQEFSLRKGISIPESLQILNLKREDVNPTSLSDVRPFLRRNS